MSGKHRVWTPFELCNQFRVGFFGISSKDLVPDGAEEETFRNNLYQVSVTSYFDPDGECRFIHLSFKANDGMAKHDWRDMQRIKNELAGEEWTGIEVFPPESCLIDTANQYHIWCFKQIDLPFMWEVRAVCEEHTGKYGGQRPWPKNEKPLDLKTEKELLELYDNGRLST